MDATAIVILVVLGVVIIILAILFRDQIKFALKGPLGTGLDFEGRSRPTGGARAAAGEPSKSARSAPASRTTASGERSVAVGGNASGTIVTGDKDKVG